MLFDTYRSPRLVNMTSRLNSISLSTRRIFPFPPEHAARNPSCETLSASVLPRGIKQQQYITQHFLGLSVSSARALDISLLDLLYFMWLWTRWPAACAEMRDSSAARTAPATTVAKSLAFDPGDSLLAPLTPSRSKQADCEASCVPPPTVPTCVSVRTTPHQLYDIMHDHKIMALENNLLQVSDIDRCRSRWHLNNSKQKTTRLNANQTDIASTC